MIVDIGQVVTLGDSSSSFAVRRMKAVLQKQGQIEPLQVRQVGDKYVIFKADPWGNEIVHAAKELGWTTLAVAVMKRYEG